MTDDNKFKVSLRALKHALEFEKEALKDDFYYGGIAKAFEVALEYAWKYLRNEVLASGLEAASPRDAIKQAGKIGLIENVEDWLDYIKVRNIAVHDYIGVSQEEYLQYIKRFLKAASKL